MESLLNIYCMQEKNWMLLLNLINIIFKEGKVPDMLKEGLLTPVYKNKGEKNIERCINTCINMLLVSGTI